MDTFLKDVDGVFVSLATVAKLHREDPYQHFSKERPVAWIAETKDGGQHRFWVHDDNDEEAVERMLAAVIPAAPGARLVRINYSGDGKDPHSTNTDIYPVICWRLFAGKVEPVVIGREEETWLTYSHEHMNLVEAPPGGRFEFYEIGGFNEAIRNLDVAKESLIERAKVGFARLAREQGAGA